MVPSIDMYQFSKILAIYLHTDTCSICSISNNSIKHKSFVCTQFKCQTVLFDPKIESYLVLPIQERVDQGAMAMKQYSAFPKSPVLLEPYHQIV